MAFLNGGLTEFLLLITTSANTIENYYEQFNNEYQFDISPVTLKIEDQEIGLRVQHPKFLKQSLSFHESHFKTNL